MTDSTGSGSMQVIEGWAVKVRLSVISGPHQGRQFEFEGHDTFLVGRSSDAHLQIPSGDPYFSRRHFVVEVNPPRCRVIDLNSRNGTLRNGVKVQTAEVADGDEIGAGHTVFKVSLITDSPDRVDTIDIPPVPERINDQQETLPIIDGYRLEAEIGRGGMGLVYRAVRESDGLPVALKTVRPASVATQKQVDRFLRECRILAELDHPNIVRFRDAGTSGGLIFLAMDLVDGPDLGTVLRDNGPGGVRRTVGVMCHVLSGLALAHSRGFVHRDIKPSNILIGRVGTKKIARLADFGLARVYETSRLSGLTMQGEIGGTPAFMAPEQVTHYRQVKPAADQYAAAATLYKLLTDRYTHDFPRDIGLQLAHVVTVPPVPITTRRPDIPAELGEVIHKALSREPEDRYSDVTAFRQELQKFT